MRARWFVNHVTHEPRSLCWHVGRASRGRTVVAHISVGLPVWWRPTAHRKTYSGITEWGVGWLLLAVQIAARGEAA